MTKLTRRLDRESEKNLIIQILQSSNGNAHTAKASLFHFCEFHICAVISKYPNEYASAEQLFHAGSKALRKALKLYIENKHYEKNKFKFSTYSLYFVKKAIESEIIKQKLLKG